MEVRIDRRVAFPVLLLVCLLVWFVPLVRSPATAQIIDLPKLTGVSREVGHASDRMNELVDRARNAALAVEYQASICMKARIEDIDRIVARTLADIERIRGLVRDDLNALITHAIERSSKEIEAIERQLVIDLSKLIDQAECAVNRSILEAIPRMLGGIGNLLGTNQIEVTAPVLYDGEQQPFLCSRDACLLKKTFDVKSPYALTYYQIKNYLLDRLDGARDDTPRRTIFLTYVYIAQIAKGTVCFMRGAEAEYISDYTDYINKARQWDIVPERRR